MKYYPLNLNLNIIASFQVINLGLFGPNFEPSVHAGMLVRDPLLVNNKML